MQTHKRIREVLLMRSLMPDRPWRWASNVRGTCSAPGGGAIQKNRRCTAHRVLVWLRWLRLAKVPFVFVFTKIGYSGNASRDTLLQGLPKSMQDNLTLHIKMRFISTVPIFKHLEDSFKMALAQVMNSMVSISTIREGGFFGEHAMLENAVRHRLGYRALTYCDLFRLMRDDVGMIESRFPKFRDEMFSMMMAWCPTETQVSLDASLEPRTRYAPHTRLPDEMVFRDEAVTESPMSTRTGTTVLSQPSQPGPTTPSAAGPSDRKQTPDTNNGAPAPVQPALNEEPPTPDEEHEMPPLPPPPPAKLAIADKIKSRSCPELSPRGANDELVTREDSPRRKTATGKDLREESGGKAGGDSRGESSGGDARKEKSGDLIKDLRKKSGDNFIRDLRTKSGQDLRRDLRKKSGENFISDLRTKSGQDLRKKSHEDLRREKSGGLRLKSHSGDLERGKKSPTQSPNASPSAREKKDGFGRRGSSPRRARSSTLG
eukprot:gene19429-67195_t